MPDLDKCRCPKKKPRKPRKPRDVCYRGTYVQRAKGISYRKLEQVPCEAVDTVQGVKRTVRRKVSSKLKDYLPF